MKFERCHIRMIRSNHHSLNINDIVDNITEVYSSRQCRGTALDDDNARVSNDQC